MSEPPVATQPSGDSQPPTTSQPPADPDPPSSFAPHRLALIAVWLATTVTLVTMLFHGVRGTDQFQTARTALQVAYAAALIWHLARSGPGIRQLPQVPTFFLPRWRLGRFIPALLVALLLATTALSDDGADNVLLLLMIATFWVLIARRRELRLRHALLGLAVAAIALLGGYPFRTHGFVTSSGFIVFLAFVPLMFTAAGPLLERTGLGACRLHEGRYGKALASFLWGCLLFVPLGLINAADGSPGVGFDWVNRWWMPASLPLFSGLVEEVWHRLFVVTLCYLLLRPAFHRHPAIAVVAAVLFSAINFGLGHDRTMDKFLTTGLLYGLPMAVVFIRRDWEHSAGAHYMINMIPWLMTYLAT